MLMIMIYL